MSARGAVFLLTISCLIACGLCGIRKSRDVINEIDSQTTESPSTVPCATTAGQSNCAGSFISQWCQQLSWMQAPKATKKYHVHTGRHVTFFEAWRICRNAGQGLATINSPEEQTLIEETIRNKTQSFGPYFIGGTDLGGEGNWIWIDNNRPVGFLNDYFNFHPGQPDNFENKEHCMNIGLWEKFLWNDAPCTSRYYFICESSAEDSLAH